MRNATDAEKIIEMIENFLKEDSRPDAKHSWKITYLIQSLVCSVEALPHGHSCREGECKCPKAIIKQLSGMSF